MYLTEILHLGDQECMMLPPRETPLIKSSHKNFCTISITLYDIYIISVHRCSSAVFRVEMLCSS